MLATVASSSSAHRLKHHLQTFSIPSKIIQTPSYIAKEGCGYSIRFDSEYKLRVSDSAKALRINIRAFYNEKAENGKVIFEKE